jgi:hypothetical protein
MSACEFARQRDPLSRRSRLGCRFFCICFLLDAACLSPSLPFPLASPPSPVLSLVSRLVSSRLVSGTWLVSDGSTRLDSTRPDERATETRA